jgi:hypothetical protein
MGGNMGTKGIEYSPKERVEGIEHFSPYSLPHCYRHDYTYEIELKAAIKNVPETHRSMGELVYTKEDLTTFLELTIKKRRCSLYMKYAPGYSPELHLSRYENFERERSARNWNLVWLLVGAALTLTAGIAARLIFPS